MSDLVLALLTMAPAFLAGAYVWRLLSDFLRLLVWQILVAILVNIYSSGAGNHLHFNLFMIIDFALLFLAVYPEVPERIRGLLYMVGCTAFITAWGVSVMLSGITVLASYALVLAYLIIALTYYLSMLQIFLNRENGYDRGVFILYLATFLYCGCSIPLFSFLTFLNNHDLHVSSRIYNMNQYLAASRYLLLMLGFLLIRKKKPA